MKMPQSLGFSALALALSLVTLPARGATMQVLHSFSGGSGGAGGNGNLVVSDNNIFGTAGGGSTNEGILYSLGVAGGSFNVLHNFGSVAGDGNFPRSGLALSDSKLYGTTSSGGFLERGTVYSLNDDGTGYQIINNMQNVVGSAPANVPVADLWAPPVVNGTTLYASGVGGGTPFGFFGYGGVFKMDTSGANAVTLKGFGGDSSTGAHPSEAVTLSQDGSVVYGVTNGTSDKDDGPARYGVVYKVNADGTGYQRLHGFSGPDPPGDGRAPSRLVLEGDKLIGTTDTGGSEFSGTLFSVDVNGLGLQTLKEFPAGTGGVQGVTKMGDKLVGTLRNGGDFGMGAVFSINIDGTAFEILHSFAGGPTDGAFPERGLLIEGLRIYGATASGGLNGLGTVWVLEAPEIVPEPGSIVLALFAGIGLAGWSWRRSRSR